MTTPENASSLTLSEKVAAFGYRVFMRNPSDTYAYFSDGKAIGCVQYDRIAGFTISTAHMPSTAVGTGYQISRHGPLTGELLAQALHISCPRWDPHNAREVRKYRDLHHFLTFDKWNAGFTEQPTEVST